MDALVVTLGLDGKAFTTGAAKANEAMKKTSGETDRMAKNMEARGKQAAAAFGAIRNQALALLAVFTAGVGIKNFTKNTVTSTASLGRMSDNLSMSAKDLSMWQLAAKNAGGSADSMTAQLRKASDEVAKAKMGLSSDSAEWFYRMGGADIRTYKDGNALLMDQARIISDIYKLDPSRAMTMAGNFGINDDLFDFIKQGPEAIERLRYAQEGLAAELARAAESAEVLRKKFDDLGNKFLSTGVTVLTQFIPHLDRLVAKLDEVASWFREHKDDISNWIENAIVWIKDFAETLDSVAQSLGGWKNVLLGLGALKVASMVAPLFQLGSALGLIGKNLGFIGTAGAAGVAALLALQAAEYLGLPETEIIKGYDDLKRGDWLGASMHLPAGDFLRAAKDRMAGRDPSERLASRAGITAESEQLFGNLEAKYGLPEGLLDSVWAQESGRGKNMLSPAGAKGHFQFMGPTAKEYGLSNPHDLTESADAAARYYRDLLRKYGGDLDKALGAYNWGMGNVDRKGLGSAPKETRDYIADITGRIEGRSETPPWLAGSAGMSGPNTGALPLNVVNYPDRGILQRGGNASSSEVRIGQIDIHTQATDAAGISDDLGRFIRENLATQSNTGLR